MLKAWQVDGSVGSNVSISASVSVQKRNPKKDESQPKKTKEINDLSNAYPRNNEKKGAFFLPWVASDFLK